MKIIALLVIVCSVCSAEDKIKDQAEERAIVRATTRAQAAEIRYRQILADPAVAEASAEFRSANVALAALYSDLRKKHGKSDDCVPALSVKPEDDLYFWECKAPPVIKTDPKPDQKGKE